MGTATGPRLQRGFTLLETTIALAILATGILSLGLVLGNSLAFMAMSQDEFICQQKAQEALESVFTARDTGAITWAQIDNQGAGGVGPGIFLTGFAPLVDPGVDGIVNTPDDNQNNPDAIVGPGPDGILGTADDTKIYLSNFQRQIQITDNIFNNPSLKQITITVSYTWGPFTRTYVVTSYISAFS